MLSLQKHIDFVIRAHNNYPKKKNNKYRLFDLKTPYFIHPLWCAMTIVSEPSLDYELRYEGALTLLYHDILEDTDCDLPTNLPANITQNIHHMTFHGGFEEEKKELFNKENKILLFKLYDKTSNLLDCTWMSKKIHDDYSKFTYKLSNKVGKSYKDLNIAKIIKTIC